LEQITLNCDQHQTIGIIGLGLMGSAMAFRLREHKIPIVGFDISFERQSEAFIQGVQVLGSAREVAVASKTIIFCLPDHLVVTRVLEELEGALMPGTIVMDTTTGDPRSSELAFHFLSELGCSYLDVAISGNSDQLKLGDVLAMVGGETNVFEAHRSLIDLFANSAVHLGPAGDGARMKLITNLVLGLNRAALAEGMAFANSIGIESSIAFDVLRQSMAYSRIMDTKGDKLVRRDFHPQAKLSQHLKDVRLMIEASQISLPLSEAHRRLLERAVEMGLGELDNTAVIEAIGK
jgi:3-hydroxyisobutyrate dehydrogenase-like beta-hydroxyacid dehydrogenase